MARAVSENHPSTWRLILIPALISLAVTLLRLTGELLRWSEQWFSTATGGPVPSGVSWVVGITWLPIPFGVYFAWRLLANGGGPPRAAKAVLYAILGLLAGSAVMIFLISQLPVEFPYILIFLWLTGLAAALLQLPAWPALFKTLLAYGLAARIPVIIVMALAMLGNWGTHYDYVGMPEQFQMPFWPRFFWLAFFPQLVFWVSYTVLIGSLAGSITAAILQRRGQALSASA